MMSAHYSLNKSGISAWTDTIFLSKKKTANVEVNFAAYDQFFLSLALSFNDSFKMRYILCIRCINVVSLW